MDIKKELFVETLLKTYGNITQSAMVVGIHRQTYYDWMRNDFEFKQRVESITAEDFIEAKKDFIESQLMKLIGKGNPAAIIFAAKTICKDRGYIEKQEFDVKSIPVNWIEEKTINETNEQTK